jgi:hypothetical protein
MQTLALALALATLVQAAPRDAGGAARAPASDEVQRGLLRKTDGGGAGYTLIAPLRSKHTFLLDAGGEVVHRWTSDGPPGQSVYLLPDGHLLRCERVPSDVFSGGGQGGRVREYDWDGNLVWEYTCADEGRLHHHDVEPLPNGNVLVIAWERKTREEALAAGRYPDLLPAGELWPDMVLEIEPVRPEGGTIVWEWHAWDHLVQDRDPELPHHGAIAEHAQRIDVNISTRELEPPAEEAEPEDEAADEPADEEEDEELARLRGLGYLGDGSDDDEQGDDDERERRDDLPCRRCSIANRAAPSPPSIVVCMRAGMRVCVHNCSKYRCALRPKRARPTVMMNCLPRSTLSLNRSTRWWRFSRMTPKGASSSCARPSLWRW